MYQLMNDKIIFALSKQGYIVSFVNRTTGSNYIARPDIWWKLVFKEQDWEENLITSKEQEFSISVKDQEMQIEYERLFWHGREMHIALKFQFSLVDDEICCRAAVTNHEDIDLMEFCYPIIGGIRSLSGNPEKENLIWPQMNGMIIKNPLHTDFVKLNSFPKYQGIDEIKTEITLLYPGGHTAMPWYELHSETEGLYMASYDRVMQTTCLRVEKSTREHYLMPGFVSYPCLSRGEQWTSDPFVISAHNGDWHVGADKYKKWASESWWSAPVIPHWMQVMKGWLRIMVRQQNGSILWKFNELPQLFAEAQQLAGIDTLYLLGWESGGFSKNWPDYEPDRELGGRDELVSAIKEIHKMGGKVMVYVSYGCIDNQSDYYKNGAGKTVTSINYFECERPFPETYSGEGSWRRVASGKKHTLFICPSSTEWQKIMEDISEDLIGMGLDGILYDVGAPTPFLCFSKAHRHKKPNLPNACLSDNYRILREKIKAINPEAAVLMENAIDICGMYMDLAHGIGSSYPHANAFVEMYRYSFPEHPLTNRECGFDEDNYLFHAHYSFLYGLRYDMSIYRCRGSFRNLPNYARFLKNLDLIYEKYGFILLEGRFTDSLGFTLSNPEIRAKSYETDHHRAVVIWNPTQEIQSYHIKTVGSFDSGITLEGKIIQVQDLMGSESAGVLIFKKV